MTSDGKKHCCCWLSEGGDSAINAGEAKGVTVLEEGPIRIRYYVIYLKVKFRNVNY